MSPTRSGPGASDRPRPSSPTAHRTEPNLGTTVPERNQSGIPTPSQNMIEAGAKALALLAASDWKQPLDPEPEGAFMDASRAVLTAALDAVRLLYAAAIAEALQAEAEEGGFIMVGDAIDAVDRLIGEARG